MFLFVMFRILVAGKTRVAPGEVGSHAEEGTIEVRHQVADRFGSFSYKEASFVTVLFQGE